jgi:hypothetical protein
MEEDILKQAPKKFINARRLWELARHNAVLLPLTHQWNELQGYRVDARYGPYLMTSEQADRYRAKCIANPDPLLIALP